MVLLGEYESSQTGRDNSGYENWRAASSSPRSGWFRKRPCARACERSAPSRMSRRGRQARRRRPPSIFLCGSAHARQFANAPGSSPADSGSAGVRGEPALMRRGGIGLAAIQLKLLLFGRSEIGDVCRRPLLVVRCDHLVTGNADACFHWRSILRITETISKKSRYWAAALRRVWFGLAIPSADRRARTRGSFMRFCDT
jgi:hypothetical protein